MVIFGYLDSGLWRSVWAIEQADADGREEKMVLKIMEHKHNVNPRNFDRHRRDAIVMEQLTASPNVVDIFGFCGNTVATEFVSQPLDKVLKQKNVNSQRRLQLSLGVARGLAALHNIPGGPIVHADIQSRQFLVTPDGAVKINDFNRCRFMAHKRDGVPCKLRIGTAPGNARSPEEYLEEVLDEKLDIFSGANVLYHILTGRPPWLVSLYEFVMARALVKEGRKPEIDSQFQIAPSDGALANLTLWAYEHDPQKRPTANDLVRELERLIGKFP